MGGEDEEDVRPEVCCLSTMQAQAVGSFIMYLLGFRNRVVEDVFCLME